MMVDIEIGETMVEVVMNEEPTLIDAKMTNQNDEIVIDDAIDPRINEFEPQAFLAEKQKCFRVSPDNTKVLKVGNNLSEEISRELDNFLKINLDVFVRRQEDMVEIDERFRATP
ncbi:Uncharacterized protein Adt_14572 [Abeliophyllum distichum]|uniref:Uncharacterized protein n=1 Tax=Abeliophyllum distichum TaxID=126358 RepID=A0ABD1U017_9LAMI